MKGYLVTKTDGTINWNLKCFLNKEKAEQYLKQEEFDELHGSFYEAIESLKHESYRINVEYIELYMFYCYFNIEEIEIDTFI